MSRACFSTVKRKRELECLRGSSFKSNPERETWTDTEDESQQWRAIEITSLCRSIVRMQESYAMTRSAERTRKMKIGHSRRLFLDNIRLSNRNLVSNLWGAGPMVVTFHCEINFREYRWNAKFPENFRSAFNHGDCQLKIVNFYRW